MRELITKFVMMASERWFAWLAVLVGAVAGCVDPVPPAAAPERASGPWSRYETCSAPGAPEACAARVEEELIAETRGRIVRNADTLVIGATSEFPLRLVNEFGEANRHIGHLYYGGVDRLGSDVVRVNFFEGGTFVLVDRESGNQTQVYSPPSLSPGGRRFATWSLDLVAGYEPNGVQIWRVTDYGPRLEWTISGGESWGASDVVWQDVDVLDFTKHSVVVGADEPIPTRMRLRLGENGIELEPVR